MEAEVVSGPTRREGQVVSIQLSTGHRQPMRFVPSVVAMAGSGLEGDRHAGLGTSRQVLLIEEETLDALALTHGAVKENITTRGIDLMRLALGTRLQVGSSTVEIIGECEPCHCLDRVRPGLQQQIRGRRGMLARVATSGTIAVGDSVRLLAP